MPENKKVKEAAEKAASGKITTEDLIFDVTPFTYDGVEYKEIDLRKIKDLTARQLEQVEDQLSDEGKGTQAMWTSIRGATLLAAVANGKPFDWLDGMKAKDAVMVRNGVFAFFIGLV